MGGELFSFGELFPSPECTGKFLNFLPAVDSMNVVNNFGSVQSSIGQVLAQSSEQFWVAARKDGDSGSLYKYEGEAPYTFHLPPGTENQQGDCLTYSSVNGELITKVRQAYYLFHSV